MTLHVVTGASRGLGAAMVSQLLREGHAVIAAARGPAPEGLEGSAGLNWSRVDLSDPTASQVWIEGALGTCARPDEVLLILNAGIVDPVVPVSGLTEVALSPHLRVNLAVPMLLCASFLGATESWGVPRRILAISSGAGRHGIPHWSAYCAAKAGLDGFVRALNAEHADSSGGASVRAVSLAPGVIDTDMQATIRAIDAPQRDRFRSLHETGGLTMPEDAAAAILSYARRDDFGSVELDDIRNHIR